MSISQAQLEIARRLVNEVPDIDSQLPPWAQRTNPIVRRQLGPHWRMHPPELGPILWWFGIQAVLVLLTVHVPLLFVPVIIVLMISLFGMPVLLFHYARELINLSVDATTSMAREYQQDTLPILRATPFTTREIIMSKVAASVWRRMDIVGLTAAFTLTLGIPIILVNYLNWYSPAEMLYVAQGMTLITLAASLIRVPLELFMTAAVGVMMGATVRQRSNALIATLGLLFFYFLLINLVRLLPMSWPVQLFVDAVLPVVLPLVIGLGAVEAARYTLEAD
ncbi:MAG: hypothetical protein ACOCYT_01845 [Chloroflexota bacterium]